MKDTGHNTELENLLKTSAKQLDEDLAPLYQKDVAVVRAVCRGHERKPSFFGVPARIPKLVAFPLLAACFYFLFAPQYQASMDEFPRSEFPSIELAGVNQEVTHRTIPAPNPMPLVLAGSELLPEESFELVLLDDGVYEEEDEGYAWSGEDSLLDLGDVSLELVVSYEEQDA